MKRSGMKSRKPSAKSVPKAKKPSAKRAPKAKAAKKPAPKALKAAKVQEVPRLLSQVVRALDAKKAENVVVLNVGDLSSITDYLVIGTATSDPHLRALRVELEKVIDAEKAKILGIDTSKGSGWTVVDAFDVMVHLFTPDNREKYRIELLWADAQPVNVAALL